VRSSTSNSEAGRSNWLKVWLLAVCLVVLVVVAWERVLLQAGFEPAYTDNRALWLSSRHRLSQPDASAIAILGASRVQRAIDVGVLSEQLNRPIVQLAVEGSSGLPVLENLAADPRFNGTVVFSVAPAFSFNRRLRKLDLGLQGHWIRAYMRQSRSRRMEQELSLFALGLFAFRSADASISRIVTEVIDTGEMPGPFYKKTYRNRFVQIDQSKLEGEAKPDGIVEMYRSNSEAYEQKGFSEVLEYFSTLVDILKAKGSRVYVLRLPSGGAVLDYERQEYPPDRFWTLMQRHVDAQYIHFEDYPELDGYLSPDGSHIAAEKAGDFTRQLASVFSARGL